MANSLFKIKYDGSFSFVPEEKLMNEIKKSHTWFTNTLFGKICIMLSWLRIVSFHGTPFCFRGVWVSTLIKVRSI